MRYKSLLPLDLVFTLLKIAIDAETRQNILSQMSKIKLKLTARARVVKLEYQEVLLLIVLRMFKMKVSTLILLI